MANLITSSLSYSKEDAQKYFLQPLFVQNSAMDYFEIMTNVKSSQKLDKFSTLDKITVAEAAGFAGQTGVTYTQRSVSVARMEAEVEQAGGAFFNTIKGELLKLGLNKDDVTGTIIQSIIADIMLRGVKRDLERQLWFSDSSNAAVAYADYNSYDGIFKQLAGLPAAQKLDIATGTGTNSMNAANAARDTFQAMLEAMPNEGMENRADLVFFCTRSMADNYRATLRTGNQELAYLSGVNGTPSLAYQGIPVVEMAQWDTHIAADSNVATPLVAPSLNTAADKFDGHICVLTVKNNIVIATDYNAVSGADVWYNKDLKVNRFRFEYVIGTNFKNTELTVTADSHTN
tara:strand:+ start:24347 stop:25381 length:1035 start_codon:yes stop_codon:yes gene_type:complete